MKVRSGIFAAAIAEIASISFYVVPVFLIAFTTESTFVK